MKRIACLLLYVVCALVPTDTTPQGRSPRFSIPPPSEWLHIDGSRNPELIPQWSIWQTGLQTLARSTELPTDILRQFTPGEVDLLKKEAREEINREARCRQRVMELKPLLATERMKVIDDKTKAIQIECRQDTLDARDRLLGRLSPEAQFALTGWVEAFKSGTQVSVPKKELTHFLKPQ